MDFNEYQKAAMRTLGSINEARDMLNLGALGISGEAGEVTDYSELPPPTLMLRGGRLLGSSGFVTSPIPEG